MQLIAAPSGRFPWARLQPRHLNLTFMGSLLPLRLARTTLNCSSRVVSITIYLMVPIYNVIQKMLQESSITWNIF